MSHQKTLAQLKAARDNAEAKLKQEEARLAYHKLMDAEAKPKHQAQAGVCRHGPNCNKRTTCPLAHPVTVQAVAACRYEDNCSKKNNGCPYFHIAPVQAATTKPACWYGKSCTKKFNGCPFDHSVQVQAAAAAPAAPKAQHVPLKVHLASKNTVAAHVPVQAAAAAPKTQHVASKNTVAAPAPVQAQNAPALDPYDLSELMKHVALLKQQMSALTNAKPN